MARFVYKLEIMEETRPRAAQEWPREPTEEERPATRSIVSANCWPATRNFSALRGERLRKSMTKCQAAAELVYVGGISNRQFGAARTRIQGARLFAPRWSQASPPWPLTRIMPLSC
jgi:hypothetical protein